jgi:hypothetical protein
LKKEPSPLKKEQSPPKKGKTPSPSPNKASKMRCPKGSRKNKAGKCIDNVTGLEVPMQTSPKTKTGTRKKKSASVSPESTSPESTSPKSKLSKAEIKKCHDEIKKHLL